MLFRTELMDKGKHTVCVNRWKTVVIQNYFDGLIEISAFALNLAFLFRVLRNHLPHHPPFITFRATIRWVKPDHLAIKQNSAVNVNHIVAVTQPLILFRTYGSIITNISYTLPAVWFKRVGITSMWLRLGKLRLKKCHEGLVKNEGFVKQLITHSVIGHLLTCYFRDISIPLYILYLL